MPLCPYRCKKQAKRESLVISLVFNLFQNHPGAAVCNYEAPVSYCDPGCISARFNHSRPPAPKSYQSDLGQSGLRLDIMDS